MFLLTWLLGVPRGNTWLFLPDLVEVWDVGCFCHETLVSLGCSGVCRGIASAFSLTLLVLLEPCLARLWLWVVALLCSAAL
ncbi:hypothetical protein Taro_020508 [Colocasia esculenta]|uniref:Uncharacterized protein n=1 Tax=Colocasia esculenta TaxID=4460 RepID=A0A843UZU1_COLES|nr:hypothetical protein [Colocasia esculenta]